MSSSLNFGEVFDDPSNKNHVVDESVHDKDFMINDSKESDVMSPHLRTRKNPPTSEAPIKGENKKSKKNILRMRLKNKLQS